MTHRASRQNASIHISTVPLPLSEVCASIEEISQLLPRYAASSSAAGTQITLDGRVQAVRRLTSSSVCARRLLR